MLASVWKTASHIDQVSIWWQAGEQERRLSLYADGFLLIQTVTLKEKLASSSITFRRLFWISWKQVISKYMVLPLKHRLGILSFSELVCQWARYSEPICLWGWGEVGKKWLQWKRERSLVGRALNLPDRGFRTHWVRKLEATGWGYKENKREGKWFNPSWLLAIPLFSCLTMRICSFQIYSSASIR